MPMYATEPPGILFVRSALLNCDTLIEAREFQQVNRLVLKTLQELDGYLAPECAQEWDDNVRVVEEELASFKTENMETIAAFYAVDYLQQILHSWLMDAAEKGRAAEA